jgi:hypothetical protein
MPATERYDAVVFNLLICSMVECKVISAAEVWNRPHGRWVSVAGVVIIRQRPTSRHRQGNRV